jgi:hypothetical protein
MNAVPPIALPVAQRCGLAVASLILGILSLTCFSVLTGIPAIICGHLARGRIRRSVGRLEGNGLAVAGLVTGYVSVAIALIAIAVIGAIAAPHFIGARADAKVRACAANLRQIEGAKDLWALENKKTNTDTPVWDELVGTDKLMKTKPQCPDGGVYAIGDMDTQPACSVSGHQVRYLGRR